MFRKVPIPIQQKLKNYYQVSFLNNSNIAGKLHYNEYGSDLKILDVYSSNLIFSTVLHNKLKPEQHVLMEHRPDYATFAEKYIQALPNGHTFQHQALNPYNWKSYLQLTGEDGILQPGIQARDHIHSKFLFTGYVHDEGLLMQWLACLGNRNWVHKFGNVRMLIWIPESSAIKILATPGKSTRGKCSIVREAFSDTKILAAAESSRLKKFPKEVLDRDSPLFFSEKDLSGPKNPMTLIEIDPKAHDINDMLAWDYVTKNLMILKRKSLEESLKNLGPGADIYFKEKISDATLKKAVASLTANDFKEITREFELWPFKPDILIDSILESSD
ncbi:hypothetical protein WICMUC_003274 [Wickerhamomyces mucosus]|uniref:rRNA adenine N(6)-methyltransferase n=1 Tax=Wickerhamomyces mucosus TaxID=1378264 RepID=A0A9P8PM77_9ASCO|nr:hypothetical protein WICMUC_003274 [Wickerhamomyces mucosus]